MKNIIYYLIGFLGIVIIVVADVYSLDWLHFGIMGLFIGDWLNMKISLTK